MLIEFKFKNFRSYKDQAQLLMTRVKAFKEHADTHFIQTDRGLELLKVAAIYGSNGGGKSNLIAAMQAMMDIVHNSFSDSLKKDGERTPQQFQFRLNTATEHAGTEFETSFLIAGILYRYGFEINGTQILREWLYRKVEREIMLFSRLGDTFEINKESFAEGEKFKQEVNENVLLVSHLAQHNQPVSKIILGWFRACNTVTGLHEKQYEKVTPILLQSDKQFKAWLTLAIKFLEITDIDVGEEKGQIYTYHSRYDENHLLIDSVRFPLDLLESEGTKKLVYFLGPLYDTLRHGRLLFVDEFDTKLHPNLSRKLIELFHKYNTRGAQLIFTAQDASLMNKDLLRRDQIWFANKNQFGESELYSLSEFDSDTVRNTSAYDKKYLNNDFGAAETMEVGQEAMSLLYGE
jgi:AAA15 family ATPase/GTPase